MKSTSCARIVRALADGEDAFLAAWRDVGDADPQAFADYVSRTKLIPWITPALANAEVRALLPDEFVAQVEAEAPERRARVDALIGEYGEVRAACESAGVPVLFMKGLTYGARFYGDVYRRQQRDVDILVREADTDRALVALEDIGFDEEEGRLGDGAVRRGMRRGYANVDVHWNLRRRARRFVHEEQLWAGTGRVEIAGRSFETLGDDYALTFQLVAMAGDVRRGASPARQWLDLFLMLRALEAETDWEAFFARRRPQQLERPCVNVLAVLLSAWSCVDEFPSLARAITRRRRLVVVDTPREAAALLERPRGNVENPIWYRRAYPYSWQADLARKLTVDLPRTVSRMRPGGTFALRGE